MKELKESLLEVLSPQELKDEIDKKMEEGARSEQSALNKLIREYNRKEVDTLDSIIGLFLTTYVRSRDGNRNVALVNADGVQKITTEADTSSVKRWEPIELSNLSIKKNVRTGSRWMEGTEDTVVKVLDSYRMSRDDVISPPSVISGGGLYVVGGTVQFVNKVAEDVVDGQATSYYPVIQGDEVNIRLQINGTDGSICRIKVPSKSMLKELLDVSDVSWIDEDWQELVDMLVGVDVVAFGGGNDSVGGREVTRFVQPRDFGFVERW